MTIEHNRIKEIFRDSLKKGGSAAAIAIRAANALAADTDLDAQVHQMLRVSHFRLMADSAFSNDRRHAMDEALESPAVIPSTNGYGRREKLKVEHQPSRMGLASMRVNEMDSRRSLLDTFPCPDSSGRPIGDATGREVRKWSMDAKAQKQGLFKRIMFLDLLVATVPDASRVRDKVSVKQIEKINRKVELACRETAVAKAG